MCTTAEATRVYVADTSLLALIACDRNVRADRNRRVLMVDAAVDDIRSSGVDGHAEEHHCGNVHCSVSRQKVPDA